MPQQKDFNKTLVGKTDEVSRDIPAPPVDYLPDYNKTKNLRKKNPSVNEMREAGKIPENQRLIRPISGKGEVCK